MYSIRLAQGQPTFQQTAELNSVGNQKGGALKQEGVNLRESEEGVRVGMFRIHCIHV